MGGAIAAWLASQDPPDALILEATFTSAIDVARSNPILRWIPTTLILRHQFQTVTYAKDLTIPTLVIHSTQDETIPYKLGKKLYNMLNGPKQFLTIKGTHNDGFLVSNDIYSKTLDAFITSL